MAITEEKLTQNEIKILQCLADGEKPSERLHYTDGSVKQYLIKIRDKMNSPTTYNAIATAIRRGLID